MPICLLVLIGLPAAGKSFFGIELYRRLSFSEDYKCYMVVYDDLIDQKIYKHTDIGRENFKDYYKKSRDGAFAYVKSIIESIISSQDNHRKHLILIDDNMYYKSMRYEYYKLAKQYKTSFLQVYIEVDINITLARNKSREQKLQVPEAVIQNMATKLEAPGKEQWEQGSLTLNSNTGFGTLAFTKCFEMINESLHKPVQSSVEGSTITLPMSELQNIDLILRKIVHEKICQDRTLASTCVLKKKEIFEKIKSYQIKIDKHLNGLELYCYLENLFLL